MKEKDKIYDNYLDLKNIHSLNDYTKLEKAGK